MNKIEDIASQHLGRTSDGGTMTRYETPDGVDSSLLVGIPRHLNREAYDITDKDFIGTDTWHAYEVSFLLASGYPVSGVVKYVYESDTPNIVESKSIKLYLNSFNMAVMGNTVEKATQKAIETMEKDLTECIGGQVKACFHNKALGDPVSASYVKLEDVVDVSEVSFDRYNEDPDILEIVDVEERKVTKYTTNALRSNCRVTNQPDWGDIYIYIEGNKTVTPESLLQYIVSMRRENHFHEEICECVIKRLMVLMPKCDIAVACLYTRRGGIDINPVRATGPLALVRSGFAELQEVQEPPMKTARQ